MGDLNIVNMNITFRNTDSTDAIKQYAEEKISGCLKKFLHKDTEVNAVLSVEKNRHIAEVSFNASGTVFKASEESEDLYASIDLLIDTLSRQLRKHKEKIAKHH